jgi:hypothetical protein
MGQWHFAAFVPEYSGGPVSDFHGVPYYALKRAPEQSWKNRGMAQNVKGKVIGDRYSVVGVR